jgi:hypothetical protein
MLKSRPRLRVRPDSYGSSMRVLPVRCHHAQRLPKRLRR